MAIGARGKQVVFVVMVLAGVTARAGADLPITTLASFNFTNGHSPYAGLTISGDGNTLYGTTYGGGSGMDGTVFSVPITGGVPVDLASFSYRTAQSPDARVTLVGNTVYGTTRNGGPNSSGSVFSVPISGGIPTILSSLGSAGAYPHGGLTLSGDGGTLYGTTWVSGPGGRGTVFSIPLTGDTPTVLAAFNGTNGAAPIGELTLMGTTLYGATYAGGASDCGTVFSVPITGGAPTVLASFNGTDGKYPYAGVTLSADGTTLYGTTFQGGANGGGTVYSLPITGGAPTILASLDVASGYNSQDGLTLSGDGNTLYGTAFKGGANSVGTVFSVPITGGVPMVLASFNGTNGANPCSDLTLVGNTLYGTTGSGGTYGWGTVFSITLSIPEPASLVVLAVGAAGLLVRRRGVRGAG
jgi:uncharacterized repeat protein (TIGR03803 family)